MENYIKYKQIYWITLNEICQGQIMINKKKIFFLNVNSVNIFISIINC